LDSVIQSIQQVNGIYRVFRAEDVREASTSTDPLVRAVALSYYPGRSGDLIVTMKPGWNMTDLPAMHGSQTPDDQNVPLLLMGASIKPGQYLQPATPADIAPTLASICSIALPNAEGRVLREALR
jgi:hypothetical protein